ncbi:MAG: hypothetical protein LASZOEIN_000910 [Candidatus Fervidibacter sp.]
MNSAFKNSAINQKLKNCPQNLFFWWGLVVLTPKKKSALK